MSITYVFEYPTFDRAIQGLSSVLLGIQKSVETVYTKTTMIRLDEF